jgi:hypothetical protein
VRCLCSRRCYSCNCLLFLNTVSFHRLSRLPISPWTPPRHSDNNAWGGRKGKLDNNRLEDRLVIIATNSMAHSHPSLDLGSVDSTPHGFGLHGKKSLLSPIKSGRSVMYFSIMDKYDADSDTNTIREEDQREMRLSKRRSVGSELAGPKPVQGKISHRQSINMTLDDAVTYGFRYRYVLYSPCKSISTHTPTLS